LSLLLLLVAQGGEQAAHADAGGAEVGDLVDLEDGVDLPRRLEDLLHLIGGEGVEAAAEAVELDKVEVAALRGHLGGGVQARVVHPLVNDADGALERAEVCDGVLGEHRQAEAGEQLGNGMVDLGVVVVRAACEHDAVGAGLLHPGKRLLALGAHVGLELGILFPCVVDGRLDLGARRQAGMAANDLLEVVGQLVVKALLQVVFLVVGQPRVQERGRARLAQVVDVEAQGLGVAGDDRAVVMVAGALVFLALPLGARHPDEVWVLLEQVHHVAMAELGRVAHALGGH